MKRVPQLDGLRGAAIALVVAAHNFIALWQPESSALRDALHRLGISGVDLFFVLSGFLIVGILLDSKGAPNYYRSFYLRRAFRILPLYWLLLALFYAAIQVPQFAAMKGAQSPLSAAFYFTFTQNLAMAYVGTHGAAWLSVTWSLAIEEQFYFAAPWAVRRLSVRALTVSLCGLLVLGIALRLAIASEWAEYVFTFTRLDGLIAGAFCALALRDPRAVEWLKARKRWLAVSPLGLPIAAFNVAPALGFSLFALAYGALLLLVLLWPFGALSRAFQWQPLRELGVLAYGVYLFHTVCNSVIFKLAGITPQTVTSGRAWLASCVSIALVVPLCWLSWRCFERPLIKWGRKIESAPSPSLSISGRSSLFD